MAVSGDTPCAFFLTTEERDLFGNRTARVAAPAVQHALPLPMGRAPMKAKSGERARIRLQLCSGQEGKDMAENDKAYGEDRDIGQRWAAALKRRYPPPHQSKVIARRFDVKVRTARAWLEGQAPYAKVLVKAWRLHGLAMVGEVLAPDGCIPLAADIEQSLATIERQLSELDGQVARLRMEIADDSERD